MVTRRDVGKIGVAAGLAGTLPVRSAYAASAAQTAVDAAKQF